MTVFAALLRAVNVGGSTPLPMSELKRLCEEAGLQTVRTYIASGNVVFESDGSEADVKCALEAKLSAHAGKQMAVVVRSAAQLANVLACNPFPDAIPSQTVAIFLEEAPSSTALNAITGQKNEEICLGAREIYVHYPDGQGRSKLRIASAQAGTARNMNTIAALVKLTGE